jgi:hypothetical protein
LATSTAMVVDFMQGSSFSERSATQGDSGTSDATRVAGGVHYISCRRRRAGWEVVGRRVGRLPTAPEPERSTEATRGFGK